MNEGLKAVVTEILGEEESVIRKAETLESIDELGFSTKTKAHLDRIFNSTDEIIRAGRIDAYELELGIQSKNKAQKWKLELILTLKDAGFVRPTTDFTTTFRIGNFYRAVYEREGYFFTNIKQLSNKQYEEFESLSDEEVKEVEKFLCENLDSDEYKVIRSRFLDSDTVRNFTVVGKELDMTSGQARRLETRALRRFKWHSSSLPKIFDAPDDVKRTVESLNAELEELYASPAFKRAEEIVAELDRMDKLPFVYGQTRRESRALKHTEIDNLGLSVRVYRCLRRAGMWTASDVISFPKEEWSSIRNLGRKGLDEVVEKMHLAGYKNFEVFPS